MPERRYGVRRADGPVAADLLAVDRVLASPRVRILKDHGRTTVAAVDHQGARLVLKRFRDATPLRIVETLALGSRALRVWEGARRLRAAGFAAPAITAVLEHRRLGIAVRSCAVAAWVD